MTWSDSQQDASETVRQMITVDYYSNFFEIDFLKETLSEDVITKLKHHFARHGVPGTAISGGGCSIHFSQIQDVQ